MRSDLEREDRIDILSCNGMTRLANCEVAIGLSLDFSAGWFLQEFLSVLCYS